MGATKTTNFTVKQNKNAQMLKALGHPARIAIIEHLVKVNSCICSDIVSELPLAQPTISQHLKELKHAGFIKGSIEGTSICYCVDPEAIGKLQQYFAGMYDKLMSSKGTCNKK